MSRTSRRTPAEARPSQRGEQDWLKTLPAEIRAEFVRAGDLRALLDSACAYLHTGSLPALVDLEDRAYRLASHLEQRLGHEATLRYLRDSMVRTLSAFDDGDEVPVQARLRLIARLTDAIWLARTDLLEETIRRQQEERHTRDLSLAKRIQERLLPHTVPEIPGWEIAGKVLPAEEVGGDYWSCRLYPEDSVVTIKLADVTGHGVAAATLVAAVKFITGGYYRSSNSPAQLMERTNRVLVRETPHEILVTMVYGWLYPDTGELVVVNAGHSPVLHYHQGSVTDIAPTGFALGLMETSYAQTRIRLEPGDLFFVCSDGITTPGPECALGEEWVQEEIRALDGRPAQEIVDRVLADALSVYGTPRDDMSIVAIRRRDPK